MPIEIIEIDAKPPGEGYVLANITHTRLPYLCHHPFGERPRNSR